MRTNDIVLICDDNYCLPTLVCIQSIIDSTQEYQFNITIHVCTHGLSAANNEMLAQLSCSNVKVVVEIFERSSFSSQLNHISQKSHVTPTALIKFELPYYFKDIDSALYLDSDIIIKGNLQELLDTNINNFYLAASYEFWKHLNRIRYTLHRQVSSDFYFNSGVMLMNFKAMREDSIPEKLWEYKIKQSKTTLMDQESLNAVCKARVVPLSISWNFNPVFLDKKYIKELNKVYGTEYESLKDIEKDIKIIHYVGAHDKPWVYKNARMRKYWDLVYTESQCQIPLKNMVMVANRRSFLTSIRDKIASQGLGGTLCYVIYLMGSKIR